MHMKSNEESKLEAMLNAAKDRQFSTENVHAQNAESINLHMKHLIEKEIPTWQNSHEIDIKRAHIDGMLVGWVTASLIDTPCYDKYQEHVNNAICERITKLISVD